MSVQVVPLAETIGAQIVGLNLTTPVSDEDRRIVREAWQQETDPRTRLEWLDRSEELTRRQVQLVEEKLAGLHEMQAHLKARLERFEALRSDLREQLEDL